MDEETRDLLGRLVEQGTAANLAAYVEFLQDSPEDAWLPASALRVLARAGEVDEGAIRALGACLEGAPDLACFTHLAKALAAFGRKAEAEGPLILAQLEEIHLTDDGNFWSFDSGLHALGYTGGEGAADFVELLASESPNRVQRAKGVYEGEIDLNERESWFQSSVAKVQEQLALKDAGTWSKKMTKRTFAEPEAKPEKRSPWMTR